MTIFLDLDETLIHSVPGRGGNPGRRRVVRIDDGDSYWVMERPLAKQMVEDCRALAPTCILSSSSQDYARAVCEALGFGFAERDIMGWQRFLAKTESSNYEVAETGYSYKIFVNSAATSVKATNLSGGDSEGSTGVN